MRLVIKSGYVIDPSQSLDGIFDVLVEDGIIKAIDTNIDIQGAEVIHAQGKIANSWTNRCPCAFKRTGF
ncbi:MAG: hypothetical protein KCCBMMGE_01273 [Candidatus Methanoperedenaceae archaeon GB37]|nr:MAG: hypothetical protein KCCBMMGE_01273 [Candidatus Methanoperedenaceae archaeon GB37]